jgi:hypothetical protein
MRTLLIGIDIGLEIYCWVLVAVAALQLCSGFGIIDIRNPRIAVISAWLERATGVFVAAGSENIARSRRRRYFADGSDIDPDGAAIRDHALRNTHRLNARTGLSSLSAPVSRRTRIQVGSNRKPTPSTTIAIRIIMAWRWWTTFWTRA